MTLIKCPECGHTALDVASTCPSCGHLLVQNPMRRSAAGLVQCRRCGKQIGRDDRVCAFCGYHAQRQRAVRRFAAGGGLLVVAAGVALVLLRDAGVHAEPVDTAVSPARPAAAPIRAEPPSADPIPARPDSATAGAGAGAGAHEGRSRADSTTGASPAPGAGAGAGAAGDPPSTSPRWTANWVNVRQGPGVRFPIARVLEPDTPIRVGEGRNGWWLVFLDGEQIGWAAGDLLDPTPPPGG